MREPSILIVDGMLFDEGLDVDGAVATGKFILHPAEASAETMVTLANTLLADTENAGYPFLRACGDAAWALESTKNPYELLRWEALLDKYMANWKAIALCQLDLAQFSGDIVMGALRAHGLCIMGDLLVPNPFHAFPDTLLDELSEAD